MILLYEDLRNCLLLARSLNFDWDWLLVDKRKKFTVWMENESRILLKNEPRSINFLKRNGFEVYYFGGNRFTCHSKNRITSLRRDTSFGDFWRHLLVCPPTKIKWEDIYQNKERIENGEFYWEQNQIKSFSGMWYVQF